MEGALGWARLLACLMILTRWLKLSPSLKGLHSTISGGNSVLLLACLLRRRSALLTAPAQG